MTPLKSANSGVDSNGEGADFILPLILRCSLLLGKPLAASLPFPDSFRQGHHDWTASSVLPVSCAYVTRLSTMRDITVVKRSASVPLR